MTYIINNFETKLQSLELKHRWDIWSTLFKYYGNIDSVNIFIPIALILSKSEIWPHDNTKHKTTINDLEKYFIMFKKHELWNILKQEYMNSILDEQTE